MQIDLLWYCKKIFSIFQNISGWSILIYIWYSILFSSNTLAFTMRTFEIIALWAVVLFILCSIWFKLNLENLTFHNEFNSKLINRNIPNWTWSEATLYANNTTITKERSEIICRKITASLPSSKRFSYSAILIRDGHIKEALGLLRPMLNDPSIGQLTRKIAKIELDLLLSEEMYFKN